MLFPEGEGSVGSKPPRTRAAVLPILDAGHPAADLCIPAQRAWTCSVSHVNLRNPGWALPLRVQGWAGDALSTPPEFRLRLGRGIRLPTSLHSCSPHRPLVTTLPQSEEMAPEDKRPIASGVRVQPLHLESDKHGLGWAGQPVWSGPARCWQRSEVGRRLWLWVAGCCWAQGNLHSRGEQSRSDCANTNILLAQSICFFFSFLQLDSERVFGKIYPVAAHIAAEKPP